MGHFRTTRTVRVEWQPRDCWVGVYWTRRPVGLGAFAFDVWVCILPMLPIHYRSQRSWVTLAGEKAQRDQFLRDTFAPRPPEGPPKPLITP